MGREVYGERGKGRLEWQVGEWRPSEAVLGWFHDLGEELEEEWKDFQFCSSCPRPG